jgi:hypothetical protein
MQCKPSLLGYIPFHWLKSTVPLNEIWCNCCKCSALECVLRKTEVVQSTVPLTLASKSYCCMPCPVNLLIDSCIICLYFITALQATYWWMAANASMEKTSSQWMSSEAKYSTVQYSTVQYSVPYHITDVPDCPSGDGKCDWIVYPMLIHV